MTERYLDPREVPAVLLKAFPSYSGRKFSVRVRESVSLTGAYWDGGSRSSYCAVELATGRTAAPAAAIGNPPQFGGPMTPPTVDIPAGWAIVEHSIFCGKDHGLTFYVRPDNAAALLPAPAAVELSREALAVLEVTAGLKSFARREGAARDYGVRGAAYDSGLAELVRLGYVNRAGALTVAGRNARAGFGSYGALDRKLRGVS